MSIKGSRPENMKTPRMCTWFYHLALVSIAYTGISSTNTAGAIQDDSPTRESHACYGSEGHIITELDCPDHHSIDMQRLSFGAKTNASCPTALNDETRDTPLGCCRPDSTDNCTVPGDHYMTKAVAQCSGLQNCSTLRAERVRITGVCDWLPRDYTNFMTAYYRCIPDSRTAQFCNPTTLLGSSVYLASENYPSALPSGGYSCRCSLSASGPIGVYAVDVASADTPCEQSVKFVNARNQTSAEMRCSRPPKMGYTLLHTAMGTLHLDLISQYGNSPWRFWLYIRASGNARLECFQKVSSGRKDTAWVHSLILPILLVTNSLSRS